MKLKNWTDSYEHQEPDLRNLRPKFRLYSEIDSALRSPPGVPLAQSTRGARLNTGWEIHLLFNIFPYINTDHGQCKTEFDKENPIYVANSKRLDSSVLSKT